MVNDIMKHNEGIAITFINFVQVTYTINVASFAIPSFQFALVH
jgi:hypothetical protein